MTSEKKVTSYLQAEMVKMATWLMDNKYQDLKGDFPGLYRRLIAKEYNSSKVGLEGRGNAPSASIPA